MTNKWTIINYDEYIVTSRVYYIANMYTDNGMFFDKTTYIFHGQFHIDKRSKVKYLIHK